MSKKRFETDATLERASQALNTIGKMIHTKPAIDEMFARHAQAGKNQIGGDHYTKMAIQPFTYSMYNGLDPMQHTIIKYVSRFRDKNGIEDLKKARHTIDLLIEYEVNECKGWTPWKNL